MSRDRSRNRARGFSGGVFTPASISNLYLWQDATDATTITQVANAVSQWNDKSGNNRHSTQGTGVNQPLTNTGTINAKNSLLFDGSNDFLTANAAIGNLFGSDHTVFVVYNRTGANRANFLRSSSADYTELYLAADGSINGANNTVFSYSTIAGAVDTLPHIVGATRNGAAYQVFRDGVLGSSVGAANASTAVTVTAPAAIPFQLSGNIGEIIIYDKALTAQERLQVTTYLTAKWINTNPLLSAAIQNRLASDFKFNATYKNLYFRTPYIISGNKTSLALVFNAWLTAGAGQVSIGNSATITECSLEHPNGTVVPITFSASRSLVMASGDNDKVSDEIPASSFGVATFADSITVWVKGLISLPLVANNINTCAYFQDLAGSQLHWYDTALTTLSSTDVAGAYVPTGGVQVNTNTGFMPVLIGRDISASHKAIVGVGDSLTDGTGDQTANGAYGRGYFFTSLRTTANVVKHAGISAARGGASSTAFTGGNTKWRSYIKYCNAAYVCFGTNDLEGGATVATLITNLTTIMNALGTNGISAAKRILIGLNPRSTSTDAWLTEANQTILNSKWDTGGVVETYNTVDAPAMAPTYCKDFVFLSSNRGTSSQYKWLADGTTGNRTTLDGTHPNTVGCERNAVVIRPYIDAL